MNNEKYTVSLIESIKDYITKLQYLGHTNKVTLRALNTYKIFHWMYEWADWYKVSEPDKIKIEELMNCIVLRNSSIILPIIEPETFYANPSTPQNMWTWRIIRNNSSVIVGGNQTLTVQSTNGSPQADITVSIIDVNNNKNGTTPFTRIYLPNTTVILTPPNYLPNGNIFDHWTLDGVSVADQLNLSVTMDSAHTAVAIYRIPQPPVGSITITKEVLNSSDVPISDSTSFKITLSKNGSELLNDTITKGYQTIFPNLELGTYVVTEDSKSGYTIESQNPVTVVITELDLNKEISFTNKLISTDPEYGRVIVEKQMEEDLPDFFTYKLVGDVNTTPVYKNGSTTSPAIFNNVPFDNYILTEVGKKDFEVVLIEPNDGIDTLQGKFTLSVGNPERTVIVSNLYNPPQ